MAIQLGDQELGFGLVETGVALGAAHEVAVLSGFHARCASSNMTPSFMGGAVVPEAFVAEVMDVLDERL